MSNYLANQLRDVCFRTQASITKPSTIAVGLTHDIPNSSYAGNTSNEVSNAGGYGRQVLTPSDANWSITATSGQTCNNSPFTFPEVITDWGWVSGVVLFDSPVYGSGNALAFGTLTNPKYLSATDQYVIPVSGIVVQWS